MGRSMEREQGTGWARDPHETGVEQTRVQECYTTGILYFFIPSVHHVSWSRNSEGADEL